MDPRARRGRGPRPRPWGLGMTPGLLDMLDGAAGRFPVQAAEARCRAARASVVRHILRLLAARRGRPFHLNGYGLPDLSADYHDLERAAAGLADAARELIPRYEPRVVEVHAESRPAPVDSGHVLWLGLWIRLRDGQGLTLEVAVDGNAVVHLLNGGEHGPAPGV